MIFQTIPIGGRRPGSAYEEAQRSTARGRLSDARPTSGDLILRVFTNINKTKPRVWLTSDSFGPLARRYAMKAGLPEFPKRPSGTLLSRLFRGVGLPVTRRSAYDRFMLGFHDFLKFNAEYQEGCPKYRFEFRLTPRG